MSQPVEGGGGGNTCVDRVSHAQARQGLQFTVHTSGYPGETYSDTHTQITV